MRPRPLVAGPLAVLVGLLGLLGLLALPATASGDVVDHRVAFTFDDPEITESSGLVSRGEVMFTVNDSGDGPYLYAVDAGSGRTVGVTTYSAQGVSDVEAIAPGPGGSVWVGDIGDNSEDRAGVDLYRVPVGRPGADRRVDARRYGLVYPDGPHDAEALLVHPTSGRVFVVTKGLLGGTVYVAPATLDEAGANPMFEVGRVPGLVTDGAFFADGRHVLLRTYGTAAVYTFPGLRPVGGMDLPEQDQGEAVAVDVRGRVFVSSEGAHSEVLRIILPEQVRSELAATPAPGPDPASSPQPAPAVTGDDSERSGVDATDRIRVAGGIAAVLGALGAWPLLRASRRRSRRRR